MEILAILAGIEQAAAQAPALFTSIENFVSAIKSGNQAQIDTARAAALAQANAARPAGEDPLS
jgi:hypothetical protein